MCGAGGMFPGVDKHSIDEENKQINSTSGERVPVFKSPFLISMKSTIYEYRIFIIRLVLKG